MKKIIAVLTAVFLLASASVLNVFAVSIPKATSSFFVNDFANVISNEDENKMQQQGEALYKKFGAQVVVVTIKSLDGASLEDYSLKLARSWGIGSKNDDNGILLFAGAFFRVFFSCERGVYRIRRGTGGRLYSDFAGRPRG